MIGHAQGVEVWPSQREGQWRWNAYYGTQRRYGTGTSEENALSQAQRAMDEMRSAATALQCPVRPSLAP
jgi:hypothetical protein